ncbi:MAG: hypothetical protein QX203_05225 [Methylococcaceae bacterium]
MINIKNPAETARYDIELKGNHEKVTQRGVKALADKVHGLIGQ